MSNELPPESTESTALSAPNSSLAIISLVAGILGLTFFPLLGSIVAIITGMMARKEIRESAGALGGDGMATAGFVMGWIGIGLAALGLCVFGVVFGGTFCLAFTQGEFLFLPGLLGPLF